jgi:cytochrome P450
MNEQIMTPGKPAPGARMRIDLDADDGSRRALQELSSLHGDVFQVPSLTRGNAGLVIHDPDAIRHVLLTRRANYVKGAGLDRVRMLLGNGLIVTDGEPWARQRRMMQPAFQSQVVRGFAPLVETVNAGLVDRWSAQAARGETIALTHDLSVVSLDIVLRALFGDDLRRLVEAEGANPFDLLTQDSRRDLAFAARFRSLTRHVRAMIARRRDEGSSGKDFLGMMMAARDRDSAAPMSERELVDEVMTLIVAGHETTASTLNWAWHLLSLHPEVDAQLHRALAGGERAAPAADADAGPQDGSADIVERVLQEALRLYPPVWLFTRRALADDVVAGWRVAAGTDIFICPYMLHRHPAHWDRPEAFDPDRFLPAATAARHRFAFLPFSAGPRFCIGAGFAMAEMAEHVVQVARSFRVEPVDAALAEPEFAINLRTRHDLHVRLVPR